MNINLERIKELVNVYANLSDEDQLQLLAKAYEAQMRETQESEFKKNGKTFQNEKKKYDEITNALVGKLRRIDNVMNVFDGADATGQAAMFILMSRLGSKSNLVTEPDIEVKITEKEYTLEEYITRHLPDADYKKAYEMANLFLKLK